MRFRTSIVSCSVCFAALALVGCSSDDGASPLTGADAAASSPDADAAASSPDAAVSSPDAAVSSPDADAAASSPDAAVSSPDADAAVSSPDAAAAKLGAANPTPTAGDAQHPPTSNAADVEAWLAQGAYKAWACETVAHSQMKVSPHGKNRICSNAVTSTFAGKVGDERPVGSAAVKELYDDTDKLVGYAVYAKVKATSDSGASWYWYERVPTTSAAPNTAGIVADGLGSEGRALSICVGCHAGAGSNDDHTLLGSSDFVYQQVAP